MKIVLKTAVVVMLLTANVAHASCSTRGYAEVQTSYPYQTKEAQGSTEPVVQAGVTKSCGRSWFDVWGSKDLSGNERFGNEVGLTAAHNGAIGSFRYEGLVAYAGLPGFSKIKDDLVQVQFDVSRPFTSGAIIITPYVRGTRLVGLGVYDDNNLVRTGVYGSFPFVTNWSMSIDVAITRNVTEDRVTRRLNARVSHQMGRGWSVNASVKFADRLLPAYGIGVSKSF